MEITPYVYLTCQMPKLVKNSIKLSSSYRQLSDTQNVLPFYDYFFHSMNDLHSLVIPLYATFKYSNHLSKTHFVSQKHQKTER